MIASVSRTKEWILESCEKNVKAGNAHGTPQTTWANTRQKKTFIKKEVLDRN